MRLYSKELCIQTCYLIISCYWNYWQSIVRPYPMYNFTVYRIHSSAIIYCAYDHCLL